MAWIRWSCTWATTRRTTTASRKLPRWNSKNFRWRRMYLLLRAHQRPKQNHEDVLQFAHLQELYLSVKVLGLILSQKFIRLSLTQCQNNWLLFFVMVIYLKKKMDRLIFWRWKEYLRNNFVHSQHWSDEKWESKMAGGGGNKKRFQYSTDSPWEILYFRALQGHSGRNLIDPSLQDNVLIPSSTYITSDVQSIYVPSQIQATVWAKENSQYSLRLWILWTRITEIRMKLTWMHHVLHGVTSRKWRRHHGTVYWVDIQLAHLKGFKFYQTRSNAVIFYDTPILLCPESCSDGNWRNHTRESICVISAASEDFLLKIIGWKSWIQKLLGGGEDFQQIQPKTPNPIIKNRETCQWATTCFAYSGDPKSVLFGCDSTQTQERKDLWMHRHSARVACQCQANV